MSSAGEVKTRVQSWGMVQEASCFVRTPESVEDLRGIFGEAKHRGLLVAQRGGGNSYGDPAMLEGGILIDYAKLNRVIHWDPENGLLEAEPGLTIKDAWRTVLESGYWLPVVPGTMFVTFGGAAAMNIHGKNNFKKSTFGSH
ncbi:MAG: FAD-dependent oxidoreductase, partial [Planctomycetes bacterium]|nr:FAD-dependent oxidoreductase [Planctomycetota bacterium]